MLEPIPEWNIAIGPQQPDPGLVVSTGCGLGLRPPFGRGMVHLPKECLKHEKRPYEPTVITRARGMLLKRSLYKEMIKPPGLTNQRAHKSGAHLLAQWSLEPGGKWHGETLLWPVKHVVWHSTFEGPLE